MSQSWNRLKILSRPLLYVVFCVVYDVKYSSHCCCDWQSPHRLQKQVNPRGIRFKLNYSPALGQPGASRVWWQWAQRSAWSVTPGWNDVLTEWAAHLLQPDMERVRAVSQGGFNLHSPLSNWIQTVLIQSNHSAVLPHQLVDCWSHQSWSHFQRAFQPFPLAFVRFER